jgi:CBS domain containing-hemolysin-like protein
MIMLLLAYLLIALAFSFLCSMLEAVLLSVPRSHIAVLVEQGKPAGQRLRRMKEDVDRPLAAILTLNTFAHTLGATGVGAEAALLWGDVWVGVVGFVVTVLMLVFSEVIPKTLGALYAKPLAPTASWIIGVLIVLLWPAVAGCEWVSRLFSRRGQGPPGISRLEVSGVAALALADGALDHDEARVIRNLIALREVTVGQVMTPRTVAYTLNADQTVESVTRGEPPPFARVPVVDGSLDHVKGQVHRHQLYKARSEGRGGVRLAELVRPLHAVPEVAPLSKVLKTFIERREQLFLVVDEFGGSAGLVTLEDALETLLGVEIMDETDTVEDMQALARKLLDGSRVSKDPGDSGEHGQHEGP